MTYPLTYGPVYTIGVATVPATPLPAYTRYLPAGTRKYYWVPAIANPAAPTRAELNAGTDLTGQIPGGGVTGFTPLRNRADVTPLGSQVTVLLDTITDANSSASEIILYASADSNDARLLLPPGTAGFVVVLPEGDVGGQRCEVWPAAVNAMFLDPDTETPGRIHFQFTITSAPSQNVLIP